ncbi:MAG: hypothetical protein ACFFED_11230 [Candidatus Thorarchaeota archaeon]
MVGSSSRFWNSVVKYISSGLCIVAIAIAYNIQYLLTIYLNSSDPLQEVYLQILLIEFLFLSAAVGILNQQFSWRFWDLKRDYGFLNMTVKGALLVGFTILSLATLSTPYYLLAQIPPPAIRFQIQLCYMIPIGLASSPVIGILAKEISFLGRYSQSQEDESFIHLG